METCSIGCLTAAPGEKIQGYVRVTGEELELPVTIIRSSKEGQTLLVTGGVHNAEYVGIQAAMELAQELEPEHLTKGCVIVVPLLNRTGFEHRTMSVVFEDGKNLNRMFPGDPEGTLSDKICDWVVNEIFSQINYHVDLHCGDGFEHLTPYVYYQGKAEKGVSDLSREMASAVKVPYMVKSCTDTGGAYNYAGKCGIPGILIERGGRGIWSREEVDQDKEDVRAILELLGFMNRTERTTGRNTVPEEISDVIYYASPCGGCWYPAKRPGDPVMKDEYLGEIKDYFGAVKSRIVAQKDGRLLYQVASLCVAEGETLVTY